MFRGFFADYRTICHRISNIVVDEAASKAATEQTCPHIKLDGSPDTLTTCNFFDFAPDGRFRRVIIWIDGANPLIGEYSTPGTLESFSCPPRRRPNSSVSERFRE